MTTIIEAAAKAARRSPARNQLGITVYGCDPDEADLFLELSPRYGVSPTVTRAEASQTSAARAIGNRCVSVGHKSSVTARILFALKESGVEYVSTRSRGLDHIDVAAAEALGMTVENVAYAPDGVADYTVMLILMAVRNAKPIVSSAQSHDFRLAPVRGRELRDLTVGVLGAGRIGEAVIRRLRGFGCRVLAHDIAGRDPAGAESVSLATLLGESDVVTLHLPLTRDTLHIIGRAQLEGMKRGAVVVNTARGGLIDTVALIAALESGKLGGAALDVLEGEEGIFYFDHSQGSVDHDALLRLQGLPNVILTPHTAYYTERMLRDTVEATLRQCLAFEGSRSND